MERALGNADGPLNVAKTYKKPDQYCLAPIRGRAIYRRLTEHGQMAITDEARAAVAPAEATGCSRGVC
ncbi:MAG: hypothetical protein P8Y71_02230 [Pseudolabrys sp.]